MVTVARLQGKLERLQRDKAREEEGFFSDLGSESSASLPRCPSLFASRTRSPSPPPPAGPEEEEKADLFLDVDKAVTSLENVLLSYRNRLPSVEAELQGYAQLAQGLEARLVELQKGSWGSPHQEAGDPPCERMLALYRERNGSLRAELEAKQELLSRSQASITASQQEREKLQRKVQELQGSLSRLETCSGGAPSPLGEGVQDPWGAAQNGLHPPWGATSAHPAQTLPASLSAEIQPSLEHLHRSVEGLQGLHRLLSGALQESKTDAERLSLLLGCQESRQTALALAVRGSERCLEAYETLLALTAREQNRGSPEAGAEAPWAGASEDPNPALEKAVRILQACSLPHESPWDSDRRPASPQAKQRLWACIGHLRAEQRSLKLPTPPPPPGLASMAARLSAGIAARVAEGRRALQEALPGPAPPPRMEKARLLRELHNGRETLADLGTRLLLTAKAKQGLVLWTHTLPAQEAACLLVIRTLQREHRALRGQPAPSLGSSSSSSEEDSGAAAPDGLPRDPERSLARMEPEALRLRCRETSDRIQALKDRLHALLVDLEEKSQDCRAHEAQEMELMQEFFQAHSALLLAYQKARHKQESQVGQLETQVGLMTRRQAKQRQALAQALQQLQDRVSAGAPTGLPQPPAVDERFVDPPGNLEVPSFVWSRK
ncbi:Usher syndrome type-1C protein-binding protein 1 isoform X2 [Crotalus tigris]|nr:Usher syndrome type-1C protein-binding protein 1 isoform X2 [Crotalus tigris]